MGATLADQKGKKALRKGKPHGILERAMAKIEKEKDKEDQMNQQAMMAEAMADPTYQA